MSISRKLRISFAFGTLLTAIVGLVGVVGMLNLRTSGLNMYEQQVVGIELTAKAMQEFDSIRLKGRAIVIHSFYDDRKEALDTLILYNASIDEFRDLMRRCYELSTTDELRHFNDIIMDMFENSLMPITEQIIEKSIDDIPDHNNRLHINVMLVHATDTSSRMVSLMTGMMELNVAIAEQTNIENDALIGRFIATLSSLLAVVIIFVVLVAIYIVRSIMKPINESTGIMGKIAAGDYEARIEGRYNDEFSKIKDAVNSMAVDLKARELKISGINYASKIQKSILPPCSAFDEEFSDYSIIWEPKDIVGGDIYWIKSFSAGTVLCVCDCTGHGTHGALLTMLVMSIFKTAVDESNYNDPPAIIWELDKRLASTLGVDNGSDISDGCDLAVVFIGNDGAVNFSSGNINVFSCDGDKTTRHKGQKLWVGDGKINSKNDVKQITIPADSRNKFYIASDGLYEQIGGPEQVPFGYDAMEKLILENHNEKQSVISGKIWSAFEKHKGSNPQRDDFMLISFKPK